MLWTILFHEMFDPEFRALAESVQDSLLAKALLVSQLGPRLGRPHADTLKASKHKKHEGAAIRGRQWDLACRLCFRLETKRDFAFGGRQIWSE